MHVRRNSVCQPEAQSEDVGEQTSPSPAQADKSWERETILLFFWSLGWGGSVCLCWLRQHHINTYWNQLQFWSYNWKTKTKGQVVCLNGKADDRVCWWGYSRNHSDTASLLPHLMCKYREFTHSGMCSLGLLQQITTNLVAYDNRNFFLSCSFGGQKPRHQ